MISTVIANIIFFATKLKLENEYEAKKAHIEALRTNYARTVASMSNTIIFDIKKKNSEGFKQSGKEMNLQVEILLSTLNKNNSKQIKLKLMNDYDNIVKLSKENSVKELDYKSWLSEETINTLKVLKENNKNEEKEELLKSMINSTLLIIVKNPNDYSLATISCKLKFVLLLRESFESYIDSLRKDLKRSYSFRQIIKKICYDIRNKDIQQ